MTNAFFPFLPFLMRYGAKYTGLDCIARYVVKLPLESVYIALGLGISLLSFCIAAVSLHRLSSKVLKNGELASLAVLLFCCNPASVFYSAAYTEALFAALTWTGLVFLLQSTEERENRKGGGNLLLLLNWAAGVCCLSLAGATRSNGILSAWFLIHHLILEVSSSIRSKKKALFPIWTMLKTIVGCAAVWSPYIAMQGKRGSTFFLCRENRVLTFDYYLG
jgi:phosphatidylinositol glycan class V